MENQDYEVIIIGGSFAGLSAAMSLGRSLRQVLVIDNGQPCNRQTPHSHNFLTQDGKPPLEILAKAQKQLEVYQTVKTITDTAININKNEAFFEVTLQKTGVVKTKKLILAWGVKDDTSQIEGLADCWGISVIHCPYCHGYEVSNQPTVIIANGHDAYEYAKMISNWTKNLTILTNGSSIISTEQILKLRSKGIKIIETEINKVNHQAGMVEAVLLKDNTEIAVSVIYYRPPFTQKSTIYEQLGCELNPMGLIQVNDFQQTTISGIYAAGDNCSPFRSVANAVAKGSFAGAMLNKELIEESF